MLDVFFTVDVEVWCDGWDDIDVRFPQAFDRYVYGRTARGDYGLSYKVRQLTDHGLSGVFFVEPLFATRFGLQPLAEIVGILQENNQEVQLHLHTEWVDEAKVPLLENGESKKRQFLSYFSFDEQTALVNASLKLVEQAGGQQVNAFRAGNFTFNIDTLRALATNGIYFDSSYNASTYGVHSGLAPGLLLTEPFEFNGVWEYPMTVFSDGTSKLRHAQLTACSYQEMEHLLWQSLEDERKAFIILSHNFELLNPTLDRPDDIVVKRFHKLCRFLDQHRDCFRVRGFHNLEAVESRLQPKPLVSPLWRTGLRCVEQAARWRYK